MGARSTEARRRPPAPRRQPAKSATKAIPEPEPLPAVVRRDLIYALIVTIAAAILFAFTFSSHVALGDGPESVSGVKSVGILHAPGYPVYVLAARAFGTVFAIGGWAFRVNLFSLLCASLVIGVVFLIGRALSASVAGAAIGALALATTASFWFNAGFAKHYSFSTLMMTVPLLLALQWEARGKAWMFVVAGVVLGLGAGAAWEFVAYSTIGIIVLVAWSQRRPSVRLVVAGAGSLVLVALAAYGFVMVRAGQDPQQNWGDATTVPRVVQLFEQRDFFGGHKGTPTASVSDRITAYGTVIERDAGLGALVVAVFGVGVGWGRIRRNRYAALCVIGGLDLVAVVLVGAGVTGVSSADGFQTGLISGGHLTALFVALAIFATIGATIAIEFARETVNSRYASAIAIAVLAALVVAPSVIVHEPHANHRVPPLADRYGSRVLSELPPNAVLMVWGEEYSAPMVERQLVHNERRDVTVLCIDQLFIKWFREQTTRRFHLAPALTYPPGADFTTRLRGAVTQAVTEIRATRPVYLDTTAMWQTAQYIGYRTQGLVGQVVDGIGPHPINDVAAVTSRVRSADVEDGLDGTAHDRFPNEPLYFYHSRAHIEIAKHYAAQGDMKDAITQLSAALAVLPADEGTVQARDLAQQNSPDAAAAIADLEPAVDKTLRGGLRTPARALRDGTGSRRRGCRRRAAARGGRSLRLPPR